MASNCNFSGHTPSLEMNKEEKSFEPWKSSSDTSTGLACNSSNAFDCYICLDVVQEPVVTLCGHLYCWPCIYKWIHTNSVTEEYSNKRPQCPVCKAKVSVAALVALYGRGKDTISYDRETANCGLAIPVRPSFPLCWDRSALSARPSHLQNHGLLEGPHHPYYSPYTTIQVPRLGGTNAVQPCVWGLYAQDEKTIDAGRAVTGQVVFLLLLLYDHVFAPVLNFSFPWSIKNERLLSRWKTDQKFNYTCSQDSIVGL